MYLEQHSDECWFPNTLDKAVQQEPSPPASLFMLPCNCIEYYVIKNITPMGPEYPLLSLYGL